MSLSRNVEPADQQMSIANQDPPSIPGSATATSFTGLYRQSAARTMAISAGRSHGWTFAAECARLDGQGIFTYAVFGSTVG